VQNDTDAQQAGRADAEAATDAGAEAAAEDAAGDAEEVTVAQQAGGADAEAATDAGVEEVTVAQQAGGADAEAATDAGVEEPAVAQQAGGADAEAATDAGVEEPAVAQQAGGADAEAATDTGAEEAEEADGEAEEVAEDDMRMTERADEPEAAATAADGGAIAADLDAARAEAESYLDDLRRLQAEFDNYRKRMMREQTARVASASQALVARLLPVLDDFELAVSAAEQSRDFDRMLKGVEMVFGELREVLQSEGLVRIEAEGKPFDPERHEAVVAVEQEGAEPGTVVDVVRTGYELRGKVLRPAMVKVAK
jgi:molecular chaperone GrpE